MKRDANTQFLLHSWCVRDRPCSDSRTLQRLILSFTTTCNVQLLACGTACTGVYIHFIILTPDIPTMWQPGQIPKKQRAKWWSPPDSLGTSFSTKQHLRRFLCYMCVSSRWYIINMCSLVFDLLWTIPRHTHTHTYHHCKCVLRLMYVIALPGVPIEDDLNERCSSWYKR